MSAPAIGIDLGTTNSVVAAVVGRAIEVVRDENGKALHPSAVAFLPNGNVVVGRQARARRVIDPLNTVFSAKRIIGRPFHDPATQEIIAHLPYRVVEGDNQEPLVRTRAGTMPIVDISATVLEYLRDLAHRQLGARPERCVVTVPANFSDGQREATRRAANRAGMEVLRIVNEPTAAALAYGAGHGIDQRIAVFDLGGGTFDVTLLQVHDDLYEVLATGGDPFLGGDDVDALLADRLAFQFLRDHRVELNADTGSRARLIQAAEEIKVQLTEDEVVEGSVPEIAFGEGGKPLALRFHVERLELEELIAPMVSRALTMTERVLLEAGLSPANIDDVILVGGSTLIPCVARRVGELFGRAPQKRVNPMQVVAAGAALQAHALSAPDDTEVAVGLLMDVTSHGLGIATAGGYAELLIDKNTPIPAEGSRVFSTARDGQTMVRIRICQGEAKRFDDNAVLGELRLDGLRAADRGQVQVEVAFLVDANGILQVSARDLHTGRDARATLSVLGLDDAA